MPVVGFGYRCRVLLGKDSVLGVRRSSEHLYTLGFGVLLKGLWNVAVCLFIYILAFWQKSRYSRGTLLIEANHEPFCISVPDRYFSGMIRGSLVCGIDHN